MTENQTIAAFDFDGTISYHDTFLPFLVFVKGWPCALKAILLELPALIGFACGWTPRQSFKERFITRVLQGEPINSLKKQAETFASNHLPKKIRPEALSRIQWHLKQGHTVVIISASPDIYLIPWAKSQGINQVLSTQLETSPDGRITGKLIGKNCWGTEKVKRLLEIFGPEKNFTLYAYGDSNGDKELLELADTPFYRRFS